jgi:hypothetical protein
MSLGQGGAPPGLIRRAFRAVWTFLRSLPGVIQAISGTAVALVALFGALAAFHHPAHEPKAPKSPLRTSVLGEVTTSPSVTPSSTPLASATPSPYLAQLEEHLPPAVAGDCSAIDVPDALAGVRCVQGSGIDSVYYLLFDSRASMDRHLLSDSPPGLRSGECDPGTRTDPPMPSVPPATVAPSSVGVTPTTPPTSPSLTVPQQVDAPPGEHDTYTLYGVLDGTLECFSGPNGAEIEWTNDELLIWGLAVRSDDLYTPVFQWWGSNALR